MTGTGPSDLRNALGRNLTYGLQEALGRAIVVGSYDDRRFPTEAELAEQHGVSRSVTREAVKMLTAKGLLSARPRQGTIIQPATLWNLFDTDVLRWMLERKFSLSLLRHFTELRQAFEPAAAALAAHTAGKPGNALIAEGYARMVAAEQGDGDPLDADIAFHVAILRASGNPVLRTVRRRGGDGAAHLDPLHQPLQGPQREPARARSGHGCGRRARPGNRARGDGCDHRRGDGADSRCGTNRHGSRSTELTRAGSGLHTPGAPAAGWGSRAP